MDEFWRPVSRHVRRRGGLQSAGRLDVAEDQADVDAGDGRRLDHGGLLGAAPWVISCWVFSMATTSWCLDSELAVTGSIHG
jgi:hypothetical protein